MELFSSILLSIVYISLKKIFGNQASNAEGFVLMVQAIGWGQLEWVFLSTFLKFILICMKKDL